MNRKSWKLIICIAFLMVVVFGIHPLLAGENGAVTDPRAALAEAEAAYDEAENVLIEAKAALDEAEAALAEAEAAVNDAMETYTEAETAYTDIESYLVDLRAAIAEEDGTMVGNKYLLESLRLMQLSQEAYDAGDYDAATRNAEKATRFAKLSDEYIAAQTDEEGLDEEGAVDENGEDVAGEEIGEETGEETLKDCETDIDCEEASECCGKDCETVIDTDEKVSDETVTENGITGGQESGDTPLPATYTVRPWDASKDCFWNIAGRPWAYANPELWRTLFDANRFKLPDPDNPNLIKPGTILDIPSIRGEFRQGEWDSETTYPPLP